MPYGSSSFNRPWHEPFGNFCSSSRLMKQLASRSDFHLFSLSIRACPQWRRCLIPKVLYLQIGQACCQRVTLRCLNYQPSGSSFDPQAVEGSLANFLKLLREDFGQNVDSLHTPETNYQTLGEGMPNRVGHLPRSSSVNFTEIRSVYSTVTMSGNRCHRYWQWGESVCPKRNRRLSSKPR